MNVWGVVRMLHAGTSVACNEVLVKSKREGSCTFVIFFPDVTWDFSCFSRIIEFSATFSYLFLVQNRLASLVLDFCLITSLAIIAFEEFFEEFTFFEELIFSLILNLL